MRVREDEQYEVEVLKKLNWYHVINNPALAASQGGQKRTIQNLFEVLFELVGSHLDEVRNSRRAPVPATLQEIYRRILECDIQQGAEDVVRARAVCDYICTLTEDQTVDLYERVTCTSWPAARSSAPGSTDQKHETAGHAG